MLQKPGINPVVWGKFLACVELYIYLHLSLPLPVHSTLEIALPGHHTESYPILCLIISSAERAFLTRQDRKEVV